MPKNTVSGGPSDATTGLGMPADDPETAVIETEEFEAGDETTLAVAPQQAPVDEPGRPPEMSPEERDDTAQQVEAHTSGEDVVQPAEGSDIEPGQPREEADDAAAEGTDAEASEAGDGPALAQSPNGLLGGWSEDPPADTDPADPDATGEPGTVDPDGETMAAGVPDPSTED